jgi:hypothetical protein
MRATPRCTRRTAVRQGDVHANDQANACAGLDGFIGLVKAQTGKKVTTAQAASFLAQAAEIKTTLGC